MRAWWNGIAVDAIDYEIVRVSTDGRLGELGAFRDVHLAEGPPWRLVSGYLMLEALGPDTLGVFSHGRLAAVLAVEPGRVSWRAAGGRLRSVGDSVRSGGIAMAPDGATTTHSDGSVGFSRRLAWSAAIVHGPSDEKVQNRIELLRSLEAVGGRHG